MQQPEKGETTRHQEQAAGELGEQLVGRTLGEYVLREQIGRGGFGAVYRAEQPRLGRMVVLKVLRFREGGAESERRHRMMREALLASRLDHPYAAHVYGGGVEDDGLVWIAMELVRGTPLDELLAQGPLPLERFVPLCEKICEVVQSAHEQQIIHRDLKPANVMVLERSGQLLPKLLDFGIAKVQGDFAAELELVPLPAGGDQGRLLERTASMWNTAQGAAVGSPGYMAPEQWADAANVDARTDLYALGALAYEALTGRRPFEGSDAEALSRAHATAPIPPVPPPLPPSLDAFFQRALAKQRGDRFSSALEFSAALQAAARVPVAKPRRRRMLPGAAAALLALVAGIELYRHSLPLGERRLRLEFVEHGGKEAWLAPVLDRLGAAALAGERRFRVAADGDEANLVARVSVRIVDGGVELQPALGRPGGAFAELPALRAPSALEAMGKLAALLGEQVGAGRAPRPLDAGEQARLKRSGAPSLEALKTLGSCAETDFAGPPVKDCEAKLAALVKATPGWPRPAIELAYEQGQTSPAAQETLAAARRNVDRAADPTGAKELDGLQLLIDNKQAEAVALFDQVFREDPSDLRNGFFLASTHSRMGHPDAREAVLEALWRARPELGFGGLLLGAMRATGRTAAADARAAEWVKLAPESASAQDTAAGVDLAQGRVDAAIERARRSLLVWGESAERLMLLCDVLLLAGQSGEARQVAGKLSLLGPLEKSQAQRRLGILETLDGRFAAAYTAFEEALPGARDNPFTGYLGEIYDSLRALAPLVAPGAQDRLDEETAQLWEKIGQARFARIARLARDLRNGPPGHCPALDFPYADLPEGGRRENLRRLVLREAAMTGCAPCAEVVKAGLSSQEVSSRSLYFLGLCAEREGSLPLARDAFRIANNTGLDEVEGVLLMGNPLWTMRARLHLARVLARMGEAAEARALLTAFLERWKSADRVVPELDEARSALAALQ